MRFSEYLRLDEGNYGHDVEKGRLPKKKKPNTVDDHGEVMLDPKTGKPFPAKGPLKDWQIPSLREDHRQYDPNVTRENEEDESKSSTPPVITNPKHPKYNPNHPTNVRRRNNKIENRMKEREAREKRLKDTIEHSEAKRKANESVEVPTRDALGRLSIRSRVISERDMPGTILQKPKWNYHTNEVGRKVNPMRSSLAQSIRGIRNDGEVPEGDKPAEIEATRSSHGAPPKGGTYDKWQAQKAARKFKSSNNRPSQHEDDDDTTFNKEGGVNRSSLTGINAPRDQPRNPRDQFIPRNRVRQNTARPSVESVYDSLEIPMRDALGRLSIHSINEASKAKLKRKLKSGNTTYAEKQASMKQLKLKQADQKKRATKRAATEPDLSIAVRAGDAASEGSVVLPGGDKPLKRSKLRPGSADLQKHEDEQADSRSGDEGTPRQKHLDK